MTNVAWMLVLAAVMVAGCSKQQETTNSTVSTAAATPTLQQQAQTLADQTAAAAQQAQANAQAAGSEMSGKIQGFLAKAREYVDSGKFSEAIAQAQEALKLDPGNVDAKNIIETAKAKIAQAGKTIAADFQNKLGSFGK